MSGSKNFRNATLNVRSTAQRRQQVLLKRLLIEECIDVLAVQESKLSGDNRIERALEPFLSGYEVCVTHAVGTAGVRVCC